MSPTRRLLSDLRRSTRQRTATKRGEQYSIQQEASTGRFPLPGDEILVKWILGSRTVWWPASITSIQSSARNERRRKGEILYHALDDYASVQTSVIFTSSGEASGDRLVSSVISGSDDHESEASSWIFVDEQRIDSDSDADQSSPLIRNGSQSVANRMDQSSTIRGAQHKGKGRRNDRQSSSTTLPVHLRTFGRQRSSRISKPSSVGSSRQTKTKPIVTPSNSDESEEDNASQDDTDTHEPPLLEELNYSTKRQTIGSSNQTGQQGLIQEQVDLNDRLRRIEQQLQARRNLDHHSLSPSARSVLVSLKWALLRALEKPLKVLQVPGIYEHGIGRHDIVVSAHCDYNSFKDIAAVLAREHNCTSNLQPKSRIAFSPPFLTTQSGSTASDNMNIIFSCISDLTSFLSIRDDTDFERILSKEVLSDTVSIFRMLGTLIISKNEEAQVYGREVQNTASSSMPRASETISVSASSEKLQTIRVFVGTSPVKFQVHPASSLRTPTVTREDQIFQSTILEQDCKHFCSAQKCYRTPWRSKNITSSMNVDCDFHLDGTIPEDKLKQFFVLNWKRQLAPSQTKWTRDVQDVVNNTPGIVRLSLPVVYLNSSRNVSSIVRLFDKHIETYMRLRSEMHASSSFK